MTFAQNLFDIRLSPFALIFILLPSAFILAFQAPRS